MSTCGQVSESEVTERRGERVKPSENDSVILWFKGAYNDNLCLDRWGQYMCVGAHMIRMGLLHMKGYFPNFHWKKR